EHRVKSWRGRRGRIGGEGKRQKEEGTRKERSCAHGETRGAVFFCLLPSSFYLHNPIHCAIAAATPFSSLDGATCQPFCFSSSHALPIITGTPANSSISTSLKLSPMAITSAA